MKRLSPYHRLLVASAISAICFIAYIFTLGPGPFWQDSGYFHAAVRAGGGLAPPGYPVYLILARPFATGYNALIPGRPPGEALNLFSGIWGALTAGLISLSVMLLLIPGYGFMRHAMPRPLPAPTRNGLFAGTLTGLLAGLSYSIWFQSITAEAYALNGFFAALILYLILLLGAEGPLDRRPTPRQRRLLLLLAVVFGLSFGNHPMTVAFLPLFLYFFWKQRDFLRQWRFAAILFLTFLACGLLPYLYLPWAAKAYPHTLYNDVSTLRNFFLHVTGSQWTGEGGSYGWSAERFIIFPRMLFNELFAVGLLGLALGVRRLWKEQRNWLALLLAFMLPAWLLPIVYLQGGEYDFWLIPLYISFFIIAGVGLARISEWFSPKTKRAPAFALGCIAILTLGPPVWVNLPHMDRRGEYVPEDFARNLFRHVSKDGVLFAWSDQECSLTYYLQTVEKNRPDVALIFAPLLASRWYPNYVRQRYPELKIPENVQPLPGHERAGVGEWVAAIAEANLGERTCYVSKRPEIAPPKSFAWIPAGGQWKLNVRQPPEINLEDWEYSYRNQNPFGRKPERLHAPKRVVDPLTGQESVARITYTSEIRMFHLQALKNLGDWHLAHGDFAKAAQAYEDLFNQDPGIKLPELRFSYGKALFAVDRNQQALPQLELALSGSFPIRAEASLYIGQIYARRGDLDRAQQYFNMVRQIDPRMWAQNEPSLRNAGFLRDSERPPK